MMAEESPWAQMGKRPAITPRLNTITSRAVVAQPTLAKRKSVVTGRCS